MRRIRIDLRLAAAAALALVTGLGVLALTRPPTRVTALVAAKPLPSGSVLGDAALQEIRTEAVDGLLLAGELDALAEHTIRVPIAQGWPLTHAVLEPPAGTTSDLLALTLERGHAVQGLLVPGDRVDIFVSDDVGTRLLATAVQVVAVELGDGGIGVDDVSMLIALDDRALVPTLIGAMRTAALDLVLVSP